MRRFVRVSDRAVRPPSAFVIIGQERRQFVVVYGDRHPTAAWRRSRLSARFRGRRAIYLVRDNDVEYGPFT